MTEADFDKFVLDYQSAELYLYRWKIGDTNYRINYNFGHRKINHKLDQYEKFVIEAHENNKMVASASNSRDLAVKLGWYSNLSKQFC